MATKNTVYDPATDQEYQKLLKKAQKAQQDLAAIANPYNAYEKQLNDLLQQQSARSFSYDMENDPLYQQYKSQFTRQGKLAMMDTVGRAAALTGGFGNSYGQIAGQQAYSQNMDKLGEVIPDLYALAQKDFDADTKALQDRYDALLGEAKFAYADYEAKVKNQQSLVNSLYDQAQQVRDSNYDAWQTAYKNAYQAEKDEKAEKKAAEEKAEKEAKEAYERAEKAAKEAQEKQEKAEKEAAAQKEKEAKEAAAQKEKKEKEAAAQKEKAEKEAAAQREREAAAVQTAIEKKAKEEKEAAEAKEKARDAAISKAEKDAAEKKKQQAQEKKDRYDALVKLISATGYIPPASELRKAGMTTAVAKAYQKAYLAKQKK